MQARVQQILPLVIAAVALGMVVLLAQRTRDLNRQLTAALQRAGYPYPGMDVPAFTTTTLSGDTVTIGEGPEGSRAVLYLFTTTCPYCRASLQTWQEIADSLSPAPDVQAFGISLDSTHLAVRYAGDHDLRFPILRFPSDKLRRMYGGKLVPETIVLDENGRVIWSRVGALSDAASRDSVLDAVRWRPSSPPSPLPGR